MVNANLRGERFIKKVLPLALAIDTKNSGTPSNIARIKAMLKTLKGCEEGVGPEEIMDDEIQANYDFLKQLARRIHQAFAMDCPELNHLSWSKLGQGHPTIKSQLILDLEKKAFDANIKIHHCEDMWAADRLLFDAFRASRISSRSTTVSAPIDSTDNNSNINTSSNLSECQSDTGTIASLASALEPTAGDDLRESGVFS